MYLLSDVDVGHVILIATIVVIVVSRLRSSHRKRFNLTIVLKRETDDVNEASEEDDSSETNPDEPS